MIRRILIEMEAEGSEALLPEIMRMVMQHMDMNCLLYTSHPAHGKQSHFWKEGKTDV